MVASPINTGVYLWVDNEKKSNRYTAESLFPMSLSALMMTRLRRGHTFHTYYNNIDYTSGVLPLYSNYSIKIHLGSGVSLYFWVRFLYAMHQRINFTKPCEYIFILLVYTVSEQSITTVEITFDFYSKLHGFSFFIRLS